MQTRGEINRRRFERFALQPGYHPVAVRLMDDTAFKFVGHAYDISEGGVRFELDRAIAPGTPVAIQIALPPDPSDVGPGRSVFVLGNVVWLTDEDEPGPVKMAAVFTRFARFGDRERLMRRLGSGSYARAA